MKTRSDAQSRGLAARVFPAPWLSAGLFVLWLMLNQSLSAASLLLAAFIAAVVPLVTQSLRPSPVRLRRPRAMARLMLAVARGIVLSNLEVASLVLHAGGRPPRSGFVVIPLALRDPNSLAVLAVVATGIPGTVWSELSLDRSRLLMHVLDLPEAEAFVADFKRRYEQPLLEIFE